MNLKYGPKKTFITKMATEYKKSIIDDLRKIFKYWKHNLHCTPS